MTASTILVLAVVASLSLHAYGLEISEAGKGFIEECRKEHNLEMDQIKEAVANKKLPETEEGKCFMECVMEKLGVLEGGKLNAEKAKAINAMKLKDKPDILEKANQIVDKCSAEVQNPGGKCEYGVEISKCAIKYAKEMGIPEPHFE